MSDMVIGSISSQAPKVSATLSEKLTQFIASYGVSVVSLDVWDTLCWRSYYSPVDVFCSLHERLAKTKVLLVDISPNEFAAIRVEAEVEARRRKARQGHLTEVTIEEIYEEMPRGLIMEDQRQIAIDHEVDVESDSIVVDVVLWSALQAIKAQGCTIALVSDFYLSETQLLRVLSAAGAPTDIVDRVFISGSRGADKPNGLFEIMLAELDCQPNQVLHIGDNTHTDVAPARRLGIQTFHIPQLGATHGSIVGAEKRLRGLIEQESFLSSDNGLCGLRQRLLWAARTNAGGKLDSFYELGVMVFGPMLAGYTEWVTRVMKDRGLTVGVCATREGLYLSDLLRRVAALEGHATLFTPLLVSRKTLYAASFLEGTPEELREFVFSSRTPMTLRQVLAVLKLSKLASGYINRTMLDLPLRKENDDARDIVAMLVEIPRVSEALRTYSVRWQKRLAAHFRRQMRLVGIEGLPSSAVDRMRVAFIDVGWSAKSLRQLELILEQMGIFVRLEGLYLATSSSAAISMQRGASSSAWLAQSGQPGLAGRLIENCKEIVEQPCTYEIGAILDYTRDGTAVHAKSKPTNLLQRVQHTSLQEGISFFIDQYFGLWRKVRYFERHPLSGAQNAIRTLLARLIVYPTRDEFHGLARWLHEEGGHFGRNDTLVDRRHDSLVDYCTLRQATEQMNYYWLFNVLHERRPALLDKLLVRQLGYLEEEDRHVVSIPAVFGVVDTSVNFLPQRRSVEAPAFVECDGRGLSYRVIFATGPVALSWRGSTPFPYFIDRVELHCRYSDKEGGVRVHILDDIGALFGSGVELGEIGNLYRGGEVSFAAPFLAESRPREIGIYVCLRR